MLEEKTNKFLGEVKKAKAAEEMGFRDEALKRILSYGRSLSPMPEEQKTAESRVTKCMSDVYVAGKPVGGLMQYIADSSSVFVKGELYMILELLNGLAPQDILLGETKREVDSFFAELQKYAPISMARQQGFEGIFERMAKIASRYLPMEGY